MPKPPITTWVANTANAAMEREATLAYPRETGGVLIGYWATTDLVILSAVPAGPRAKIDIASFSPDSEFHATETARHYHASHRLHIYLGDWHSHPDGAPKLSSIDRRTLRRIAKDRAARIRRPIMAILSGAPGHWTLDVWCHTEMFPTFSKVTPTSVKLFTHAGR